MTRPVPAQCPLCGGTAEVTEVACRECNVQVRGQFTLGPYDRLAPEQQQFLETFLRCRGVIRDVETALGISYPTVRSRLDSLLVTLGLTDSVPVPDKAARRREILAAINAGTLDVEAGQKALEELQRSVR